MSKVHRRVLTVGCLATGQLIQAFSAKADTMCLVEKEMAVVFFRIQIWPKYSFSLKGWLQMS